MAACSTSHYFKALTFLILFLKTLAFEPIPSFSYKDFEKDPKFKSNIVLFGNAKVVNGSSAIHLSGPGSLGAGKVMYRKPIKLIEGKPKQLVSFSTYFAFSTSSLENGDGLAFVMVPNGFKGDVFDDSSSGFSFGLKESKFELIGVLFSTSRDARNGGSTSTCDVAIIVGNTSTTCDVAINIVGGASTSCNVALNMGDTSTTCDVAINMGNTYTICDVAIDVGNNSVPAKLSYASSSINLALKSGRKLHAWIDYEASSRRLEVRLSQLGNSRPSDPLLWQPIDLSNVLKAKEMFVGFSPVKGKTSQACFLYSWNFTLSYFPHWMHSEPLDPKALVNNTKPKAKSDISVIKPKAKSDCLLRVLAVMIFGAGCLALTAFIVLYLWTIFGNRRPVVPEEFAMQPADFEYKKVNIVVDKTIEGGKN